MKWYHETRIVKHMFDGTGEVIIQDIANEQIMNMKNRVFLKMTLNQDCSLGLHTHYGEQEIYYILEGSGMYRDDDQEYMVHEGDVLLCETDHQHAIRNHTSDKLVFIALVIRV